MASYQDLVTQVVLEAPEPLTLEEVLQRVRERQPVKSANPKKTIRNALYSSRRVEVLGDGRYVYGPRAVTGSSFRILLADVDEFSPLLPIGDEVAACLTVNALAPSPEYHVALRLAGGPTVEGRLHWHWVAATAIELPGEFWAWLARVREGGADSLILRCLDGESAAFSVEGSQETDVDAGALSRRDEEVLSLARGIFRTTADVSVPDFYRRLVVRGAYKGEPQPSPLNRLLFQVDGRFVAGVTRVSFRGELTSGLLRLFGERLEALQEGAAIRMDPVDRLRFQRRLEQEGLLLRVGEVSTDEDDGVPTAAEEGGQAVRDQSAQRLYRLRVRLQWKPGVWRVIEMLDNQDLESLHLAIQDAFEWDNDHLYAFFLSGRAWDSITEIPSSDVDDIEPPCADEVTLGDLELKLGQRFLYIFDFGDELRHDVEVLDIQHVLTSGEYPRIAEAHGKAPPQYPDWGKDSDEDSDEE